MKRNNRSGEALRLDASVALDEEELMPEEVAVLKMIHSTTCSY